MKLDIICYHYIYSEENSYFRRGVNTDQFREHLEYLKDNYEIIHFSEIPEEETDRRMCIVTFDDGLKECYTKVFPLLRQMNAKAVFFICSKVYNQKSVLTVQKAHMLTHRLGSDEFRNKFYAVLNERYKHIERKFPTGVNFDEIYPYDTVVVRKFKLDMNYTLPVNVVDDVISNILQDTYGLSESIIADDIYMTDGQLKEMCQSELVEIGAHTHSHYLMSRLSRDDQAREIKLSVEYLQENLGCTMPITFSYPFGRKGTYNQLTKDILSDDGRIQWACNMQRKVNMSLADRLDIHRFDVNDFFEVKKENVCKK
ncbi:MAG: polysaccharide deacetylase family protein [Candidatus Brocadiaceae bacterium]|nr:polysaccharide deacetylase family protein [Candidatus Brocadiaceae bacterium]